MSCRSEIADTDCRQGDRLKITDETAGIAEKTLDGICKTFLTLVDLISDKHLERLHGHVDGSVKKHQGDKAENHSSANCQSETSGIREKTHDHNSDSCSKNKVRQATAETIPCAVTRSANQWLHNNAHQRGQNPEIAQ